MKSPITMPDVRFLAGLVALFFVCLSFAAPVASAAAPKTYQVTGPVLELTDDLIVVQKGKERWELARTADSKIKGELKVGSKVTIEYRMTAASVEVKDAPSKKAAGAIPTTTAPASPAAH